MISVTFNLSSKLNEIGLESSNGILLYGPPGTGKTLLIKVISNELKAKFYYLDGPEIASQKTYGEAEQKLRAIFAEAEQNSPSIIFIDEMDSIGINRDNTDNTFPVYRLTSQLLTLMDGMTSKQKVVVIGSTNRLNMIDPALRRPGRFDKEIAIKPPDKQGRLEILKIYTRKIVLAKNTDLNKIADETHGYVGADLNLLVKEAAVHALKRSSKKKRKDDTNNKVDNENIVDIDNKSCFEKPFFEENITDITIRMEDFLFALDTIKPSLIRTTYSEGSEIRWENIGGLQEIKQQLQEALIWPIKYTKLYKYAGLTAPKGFLLYGPPGTGKTLLAEAVAKEIKANFISIKGPELLNKWIGESERAIRQVFKKAKEIASSIIFFDEFDAIATRALDPESGDTPTMQRIIDQLLTEMDGFEPLSNVFVIAATNNIGAIHPALLRLGRFDKLLFVAVPNKEERIEILKIHTKGKKIAGDIDMQEIVNMTNNFTGADLNALVMEANMISLREHLVKYPNKDMANKKIKELKIKNQHFITAKEKISLRNKNICSSNNNNNMYK